jgi:predicted dehydrogenase
MDTIRIGIVGTGFGANAHLPALLAHPRFDVVALASPHSAARVAAERGIAQAFESCEQMLAGCAVDAVTVASPPFSHLHDVVVALEAGKHVVCEKPFALDVAQARTMVEAQRRAGTACGVAHEFRFVPQAQALRQLVANHHLDPLRDLEITSLRDSLTAAGRRARGWWFDRKRGGGLAGAMMSHLIDHANWLAGAAPARTVGLLRTANPQRRDDAGTFTSTVDDGAFALLEYEGGAIARLTVDGTTAVDSYTCAVHGEERTAVASGPGMTGLTLYSIDPEETNELQCKPSPFQTLASVNSHAPFLAELYEEFAKKIDGAPNTLPTFDEALTTQECLAAIGYGAASST